MTRPLAITKRQAKTLMRVAAEIGGIIEVKTEIGLIRLIPANLAKEEPKIDPEPEGTM